MKGRSCPLSQRKQGGFTLIELLVVIAVVALLMAITFPVFAQSRQRAHQTSCLSNIRQVGIAVLVYLQDNDEAFPNGVNANDDKRVWPGQGWAGGCFPYLRSATALRCPGDTTIAVSPHDSVVSYALNNNLVGYADADDPVPSGQFLGALTAPGRTIMLFEVAGVLANVMDAREGAGTELTGTHFSAAGNGLDNRLYAQKDWSTRIENQYATGYMGGRTPFDRTATQFPSPTGRHTVGANYLFADGHARLLRGERVSSGRTASADYCHQDNLPLQTGCSGQFQAAGTGDMFYTATFSIR